MTMCTIPTGLNKKSGGKLICSGHKILLISTYNKAIVSMEIRTTSYPYRYTATEHLLYGGTYFCFCEVDSDISIELRLGSAGYTKKMPYWLQNDEDCATIVCMPPNPTTGQGDIASLSSLCHATLLLAKVATEEALEDSLPITIASQIMIAPKLRLGLIDDMGNRKVTCQNRDHTWQA